MDRLMMLHVQSKGAAVEVLLNDMPVITLPPEGGTATQAVHEHCLAGRNRLAMRVGPLQPEGVKPQPVVTRGDIAVHTVLALVHKGQAPTDTEARVLSRMSWQPAPNERVDWPFTFHQDVSLPVNFPRWRWLDAPAVDLDDARQTQVLMLLQDLALDLQLGSPDRLLDLARLRSEELAVAYQSNTLDWQQAIRNDVQRLFEAGALATVAPPQAGDLALRVIADGRLIDCVGTDGAPALRSQPMALDPADPKALTQAFWPLRLACVEGKLYALR